MNPILKNAPVLKEKNLSHRIVMLVLAAICSAFLLATALVGFMSKFTASEDSAAYCVFKMIFAFSLIISAVFYYTNQKMYHLFYASFVGLITSLFPFISSIRDMQYVKSIADKFSMSQDYTAYLISIGIYLLYTLLCALTALYVTGFFNRPVFLMALCVVTSLATLFETIDKALNYDTTVFALLAFASTSLTSLMPIVALFSADNKSQTSQRSKRKSK